MLNIGDLAPDFSLFDQSNNKVSLSDFIGKKSVVIYFYPKDNTSGCTAQSCSFRDNSHKFKDYNAQIIGISQDDTASHNQFASNYNLRFPLLSDVGGKVSSLYGVTKTLGLFPGRVTFVISPDGVIRSAFSSQIKIQKHIDSALEAVKTIRNGITQS